MADGDFNYLTKRTAFDKILCGKAFNIAKNAKYDGYQCGVLSVAYKFFEKKFLVVVLKMGISAAKTYLKNYTNQLLEIKKNNNKYTRLL